MLEPFSLSGSMQNQRTRVRAGCNGTSIDPPGQLSLSIYTLTDTVGTPCGMVHACTLAGTLAANDLMSFS